MVIFYRPLAKLLDDWEQHLASCLFFVRSVSSLIFAYAQRAWERCDFYWFLARTVVFRLIFSRTPKSFLVWCRTANPAVFVYDLLSIHKLLRGQSSVRFLSIRY
jgi:hypothetical protein